MIAVAGCVGDDDDIIGNGDDDDPGDDDPGDDDPDAGSEDSDPADDTNGDTADEGDSDTSDEDGGDTSDEDGSDPDDDTNGDTADETGDGSDGDLTFADVFAGEFHSFEMEFEFTVPEQVSGRMVQYGDDYYGTWSAEGAVQEVEIYEVGDYLYQVIDGECFKQEDERDDEFVTPDDEPDEQMMSLSVSDITFVDGEEVYVFEDGDETWYVSTSTGYPVRAEMPEGVVTYSSWNDVDPITPPDMDCQDFTY